MAPRLKYLPVALSKTLMPFQQEGVLFGISKNGRCLIGDEMGLGKTLQALSIAYYYKDEWPLLIVCPSSMRFPWIEEIEKWLPDVQPGDINLVLSGTDVSEIKNCKITLVGYGLLSCASSRLLINSLKDTKFGVVIVDESHYMKNRKATRTKALVDIIRNAERAILLTGTPALARPEELYVQIEVLKPKLVGTFAKFATRYCEAHTEYICGGRIRKWNTQGASNLDELHRILKENVMVRRLKRNVLTQLPPKRRQKISFDIAESDCKKDLTELIKDFRNMNKQIHGCASNQTVSPDRNTLFEMHRLATQLYKQTGLSKVPAVRQYIADMLENTDKKFLVFSHHLEMQKAIELEVIKKKVKYIRIAGDVPSIFRGALVNQFQNDSDVRVAILSLLAASVGLTLTAADHVIFAELHWTPGVMEQAEDRVHRIGQENSVLVQYLVAKGTVDEVLWRMLNSKVYVTSATLNGETRGMDVEEGSEGQSKLLEAFSAWVEEEEEAEEEEFLFTMSQKKRKQDAMQRSLTEFFHSPSSAKSPKCRKTDNGKQFNTSRQPSEDGDADIVWLEKSQLCAEEPREITPKSAKDDTVISVEGIQSTHGATKMPLVSLEKTPFTRVVEKIGTDTNSAIVSEKIDGLSKNKMASGIVVVDLTSESNTSHDTKCLQIGENNSDSNSKDNNSDAEINNKNLSAIKEKKKRVKRSSFEKDLNDFKSEPWICSVCTLENNAFLTLCEMCDTPRQISRRKTKTMLSTQEFIKRKQQKLFDNCSEPAKPKKGRKAVCKRKGAKRKTVNTGDGDVHICYSTDNKQEIDKGIPGNTGLNMGSTGAKMDLTLIKDDEDEISGVNRAHQVQIGAFSDNNRCGEKSGEFETVRVDIGICENGDVHKGNEEILSDCEKGGHGIILDNQVHEGGTGTLKHLAEFGNIDEKEIESNPNGYNDKSRILGDNAVQTTSEVMDIGNDTRTDATEEGEVDIIGDNNVHGTIIGKTENKMEVVERDNTDEIDTDPLTNIDSSSTGCGAIPQEDISEPVDASDSDARTVRDELQTTDADDLGSDELFSSTADECDDVTTPGDPWTCDVCGTPNSPSLNACAVCGEQRGTAYGGDLVTNMDDDYWRCEDCGELCLDDEGSKKCRQCAERHEKAREAFVKNWRHLSYLLTDDNEGDAGDEGISGTIGNMMYCMSPFTDRVYLYRENGDPLACNVSLHDLDACGKSENLPVVLKNAENRKQVLRFLRKWKSLPERQKRSVKKSGLVFEDPYQVAEAIKMGNEKLCISRHPTKEKLQKEIAITAEEKNGSVRMCTKIRKQRKQGSLNDPKKLNKNNNSNERTWVQAVDQNGCPLCISCQAVVNTSNTDCEWDERFCSHKCKENYQIRLSGTCVRSKLFEEERGVCQKCSLDAHGLYRSLLLLPKADRRAYLENTPFLTLPVTLLNKIIIDPKEGMFWEADHVIPVVEGGGECGLDNYRTLCVPCHRQVTAELRDRIKLNRQKTRTAGIPDISTFFKP